MSNVVDMKVWRAAKAVDAAAGPLGETEGVGVTAKTNSPNASHWPGYGHGLLREFTNAIGSLLRSIIGRQRGHRGPVVTSELPEHSLPPSAPVATASHEVRLLALFSQTAADNEREQQRATIANLLTAARAETAFHAGDIVKLEGQGPVEIEEVLPAGYVLEPRVLQEPSGWREAVVATETLYRYRGRSNGSPLSGLTTEDRIRLIVRLGG